MSGADSRYPDIGGPFGGPYLVVFDSGNELDSDDDHDGSDIYAHIVDTSENWCVTRLDKNGVAPTNVSRKSSISTDGLSIAFESRDPNLADNDPGGDGFGILCADVTDAVTIDPAILPEIDYQERGNGIPGVEASRVCYWRNISGQNQESAIYGYDLAGATPGEFVVGVAWGGGTTSVGWVLDAPDLSEVGDRIAFSSNASDLLDSKVIQNSRQDVFVWFGDLP